MENEILQFWVLCKNQVIMYFEKKRRIDFMVFAEKIFILTKKSLSYFDNKYNFIILVKKKILWFKKKNLLRFFVVAENTVLNCIRKPLVFNFV